MTWLLLAIISSWLIGAYEVTRKAAVDDNAPLPVLFTATAGGLLVLLPLALVSVAAPESPGAGWLRGVGLEIELLDLRAHFLIFLKSMLVSTAWAMAYGAVKELPISVAGPLRATSPIFTVLGALVLFAETPTASQWAGMGLIFLGYFGFALLGPREGISFVKSRAVWLLVSGTMLGSASGLYDKFLLQQVEMPPTSLQFWFTFYNLLFQAALCRVLWWDQRKDKPYRFTWLAPAVGCLLVLADQFYLRAMAIPGALVSVISLTRRSSVLVSFTVGGFVFRESLLKTKAVPLAVILAGVLVLVGR